MRNGRGQRDGTEFSPRQLYIGQEVQHYIRVKTVTEYGIKDINGRVPNKGSPKANLAARDQVLFAHASVSLPEQCRQVRVEVEHLWPSSAHLKEGGSCLLCRIRHYY